VTFNQFIKLPAAQQGYAIVNRGKPVASRIDSYYRYRLIQLDSFYIEIAYSLRLTIVQYITAFDDTDLLEPYLREMDIELIWK